MEEKIQRIIAKVRSMYKYASDFNCVLENKASIKIREDKDGLHIASITFAYYDMIIVGEKSIRFHPEHGQVKTLATYKNFDALLEDKICLS